MSVFVTGFLVSLSLILAIGAQNAFVLKQGLRGRYVHTVVLICAGSDAILIAIGVSGFHLMLQQFPALDMLARYAGALFLFAYGALSFHSALTTRHRLEPEGESTPSQLATALVCLGFTWLNPHVYLDTLVLIGSISSQYPDQPLAFALGSMLASLAFFSALGYGAALLRPIFARPFAWTVLEAVIGLVMWTIAAQLIWFAV